MSDENLREALEGLIAKWRELHSDDSKMCIHELECADELEAALASHPSGVEAGLRELQEAVAPGKGEQPNEYYVKVAKRRRQMEIDRGGTLTVKQAPQGRDNHE